MDEEQGKQRVADDYLEDVKWLREHVAPDDIYDFAQQALMAAEYFIPLMADNMNLVEEMQKDKMLAHWIVNIHSLHRLREENFQGIIDVTWRVEKS